MREPIILRKTQNNGITSAPDSTQKQIVAQFGYQSKYQQILIAILLILGNITQPWAAVQQSEKMWSLLTLAGNYGKVVYYVEPQLRLVFRDDVFQQFLGNMGMGYQVHPDWQFWFGQTFSADSQDAVPGNLDEYRLWQQIIWKHALPSALFVSRTRFEERKSLYFPSWAYRLRQRVMLNRPLNNQLSLVIGNEIFFNVNQVDWVITDQLDQNRAYIGIERRMSENTYMGVGYMNQYLSTPIPQSNHVLCVNWRIDLEEKAS